MPSLPAFLLESSAGGDLSFPTGRPAVVCFVKEDCPTCNDVVPLLEAAHRQWAGQVDVLLIGQTTQGNARLIERHGLSVPVLDDSLLKVSFAADIDTVPTLFVADAQGEAETPRIGFVRDEWQTTLTEVSPLDLDWSTYPEWRPGCGSLSVDPDIAARLQAEAENSPLRAPPHRHRPGGRRVRVHVRPGLQRRPAAWCRPRRNASSACSPARRAIPRRWWRSCRRTWVKSTVEKLAINAVMAGCRPEYLPVIIAGIEAVCTDAYNIHGVMATTMGASPVLVVNGPIRHELGHEHEARRAWAGQPGQRHHRPRGAPGGPQRRRRASRAARSAPRWATR